LDVATGTNFSECQPSLRQAKGGGGDSDGGSTGIFDFALTDSSSTEKISKENFVSSTIAR
jgi:hypothetical protein